MLHIKIEKSFKKDIERDKKSGAYSVNDFDKLKYVISILQKEKNIDKNFKKHTLRGNYKDLESIHIKNDWLLIFKIDEKYLNLIMLGKHTQVYKKFN